MADHVLRALEYVMPKNRKQRRLERKTPGQVANEAMQKPNPEMNGLKAIVSNDFWSSVDEASGSPLTEEEIWRAYEDLKREYIYWKNPPPWDPPETEHISRYPVHVRQPVSRFPDPGCLPPPGQSFEEHEVRHTEGTDTVEVWRGQEMICRIPVTALQAVLMEELY